MNKQEMLESVASYLSQFGKLGEREKKILEAMDKVYRANFVEISPYLDTAIPIGFGQTISQPSTVARMLQLLELKDNDSALEIGTGSGWNAALIAYIVGSEGRIVSLEIYDELIERAKSAINKLKIRDIEIRKQNFLELDEKFDKIIFTAGISPRDEEIIEKFAEKSLNENGILIVPFKAGHLIILKKQNNKIIKTYTREEYVFVPLIL